MMNKRGYLTKQGGRVKTWKRRLFLMNGSVIYYFKNEDAKVPKGTIRLTSASKVEKFTKASSSPQDPYKAREAFSFRLVTDMRTFWMCDHDETVIDEWRQCIKNAIKSETAFEKTQKCSKLGWMYKQGGKIQTWKRRFFILKDSALFYHKTSEDLVGFFFFYNSFV